jgi:hypothetical protein
VAIFEGRFHYFCGPSCKDQYQHSLGRFPEDEVATAQPPEVAFEPPPMTARQPSGTPKSGRAGAALPDDGPFHQASSAPQARLPRAGQRRIERFLFAIDLVGIVLGALVPAVELLGSLADLARVPLALGAWVALLVRMSSAGRDPADPHALVILLPTGAAVLATCAAAWSHDPHSVGIAVFAGLSCSVAIAIERLVLRGRSRVQGARERIERALDVQVRVLQGDAIV